MRVFETADEMRAWSRARRREGKSIGFVPTMGALHEGHASLMRASAGRDDCTVLSIFVNPTQFAPNEDFGKYPRTFESDYAIASASGVAAVYVPNAADMYPEGYATHVEVDRVTQGLCGASRPHFFRGVCTVVAKLFNAVEPDRAYFGQKDAQQSAVVRRMAADMDWGIEIVVMPIIREADGLAMSSRNRFLNPEDRESALCLPHGLAVSARLLQNGERDPGVLIATMRDALRDVKIDYVECVDADTMQPVKTITGRTLLAAAIWAGETRLIDNLLFDAGTASRGAQS